MLGWVMAYGNNNVGTLDFFSILFGLEGWTLVHSYIHRLVGVHMACGVEVEGA
jgi:hypothetical protein